MLLIIQNNNPYTNATRFAASVTGNNTPTVKKDEEKKEIEKKEAVDEFIKSEDKEADKKSEANQVAKKSAPPAKSLARADIIGRINNTLGKLGDSILRDFAGRVFDQGKEFIKQSNLNAQQRAVVQQAAQASPLGFNKGLKDFNTSQILMAFSNITKKYGLGDDIKRTGQKIMDKLNEKGSFSAIDFAGDKEAMDVLNDPEKLTKVLLTLQEATDQFMEETQNLLNDPRKSAQEKAEATLNIATAVIEAEKFMRIQELQNQSYTVQGRQTLGFA